MPVGVGLALAVTLALPEYNWAVPTARVERRKYGTHVQLQYMSARKTMQAFAPRISGGGGGNVTNAHGRNRSNPGSKVTPVASSMSGEPSITSRRAGPL